MKNLLLVLVTFISIGSFACDNLLNEEMRLLDSTVKENLCKYEGKVMLVVNVASKCGYTGQYKGLQSLYERFKDQEFVVIGVPSRDFFSQEFSDESQIAEFCETNFEIINQNKNELTLHILDLPPEGAAHRDITLSLCPSSTHIGKP